MTSRLDDLLDLGLGHAFAPDHDSPAVAPLPLPPTIGRYTIRSLLGRGGLGTVYLGRDEELDRDVAIKVLNQVQGTDEALLRRFREEAKTCSQLPHPGIVSVHELGTTADGCLYYTMRVVTGETLQQLLRAGEPAPPDRRRFLTILERAAQAVSFAHSRGIVHGDLTPANIMVGEFGEVQVLDWGLSRRAVVDEGQAGGVSGRAVGTPAYMAPEQALGSGSRIDRRTDVFGLGAILCEILTGAPPYVGASIYQVHQRAAQAAIGDALARLQSVSGDRELADLAQACLAPNSEQRPADAAAVAHALSAHLLAIDARARRFELEGEKQQVRAQAERRARRLTTVLAVFVVLMVVAASAGWLWLRSEQERRRTRANERAVAALTAARQMQASVVDAESLRAALAAVATAETAATAADVDPQIGSEVHDLRTALVAAERDEETRSELAGHRWHTGDDRAASEIESDYRAAFARCGIDIDAADRDAVTNTLRAHRLHQELESALHWWALHRRRAALPTPDAWLALIQLADRCDLDPRRTDLRRAFLDGDVEHLRTLAATPATIDSAPETIALLGRFLLACSDRKTAIALGRRAHVRHPYDYALCHDLANLLAGEPRPPLDEITALMTVGAALRPTNPHALVDLAVALIDQQRFEDARPIAAQALALDTSYSRSWSCIAVLRERSGDLEGALTAIREYVRLEPKKAVPRLMLARLLERTDRGNEALAACRAAVTANPRWGEGLLTLGRLLCEREELVEALEVLQRALPLARDRGMAAFFLGQALNFAGLHSRAVEALRDARRLLPDNPHVTLHFGAALRASGQLDEAVQQLAIAEECGEKVQDWPYPSARLLAEAKELRDLAPELTEFLRNQEVPGADRAVLLGDLAVSKGHPDAAIRLYAAACAENPTLETRLADRWGRAVARVAFLADPATIAPTERVRCAGEALRLLQVSLRDSVAAVQNKAIQPRQLRRILQVWTLAPELQFTRQDRALDWLPALDRAAWQSLWGEVERALAESR